MTARSRAGREGLAHPGPPGRRHRAGRLCDAHGRGGPLLRRRRAPGSRLPYERGHRHRAAGRHQPARVLPRLMGRHTPAKIRTGHQAHPHASGFCPQSRLLRSPRASAAGAASAGLRRSTPRPSSAIQTVHVVRDHSGSKIERRLFPCEFTASDLPFAVRIYLRLSLNRATAGEVVGVTVPLADGEPSAIRLCAGATDRPVPLLEQFDHGPTH